MSALATPLSIPEATTVPGLGALRDVPAVLILYMYHSGLGIARALSGKGMRVIGLSADPKIYGNFTRFCEVRRAPNSQDAPKQLLETLRNMADEFNGAVVFPTRDADVLFLDQFRSDYRPQYVLALSEVRSAKTGSPTWYRISVPGRPNGRTGWVPAASLDLHPDYKRLIIYRGARRFEFWDRNRLLRSGKVAVGKPGAETPLGLFYVTWKFNPQIDPSWAILGAYAFETSAYSKLTDWPGGGIVGVHGTPWPQLLGQAVSHGCIRMGNWDIEWLKWRVPLGMPVKIVR